MRVRCTGQLFTCLAVLFSPAWLPAQQTAPAVKAARQQRILKLFDKDGDGKLSAEEREEARRQIQKRLRARTQPGNPPVPDGVKVVRNVEYASVGQKPLLLDLYLPQDAGQPRPVIVWVHGGGWRAGSKERCPAIPLSGQGYAVVSINYRLSNEAVFPAQIEDCKGAIRWVRAHAKQYGFDPDRIGVWGSSAGGHLVALLGTSGGVKELEGDVGGNLSQSSRVQAVCDFCGPSSFRVEDFKSKSAAERTAGPAMVQQLFGGPLNEKREVARLASPVEHVSRDDPPFLIVHGDKDPVVPVAHSRLLAERLEKAGVDVTLQVVPGAGHGVASRQTIKMAAEFFDKHLKARRVAKSASRPSAN